jgi:hypothetical protein
MQSGAPANDMSFEIAAGDRSGIWFAITGSNLLGAGD